VPEVTNAEQLQGLVFESLSEMGADSDAISRDATLEQLDIDSLDIVELCQIIEEKYEVKVSPDELRDLNTVGQAIDAFATKIG
jgi:acyl carrier protein